jgi:hypothetical protein
MAKPKKTTRSKTIKLWTKQDLKQLRSMARQEVLARVAAKKLKRTLAAVYMKASTEGIRFGK